MEFGQGLLAGRASITPTQNVGRQLKATVTNATRLAAEAYGRALSRAFKQQADLFQAWGAQGGKARARQLTADQRRAIARKAAHARWAKQPGRGTTPR